MACIPNQPLIQGIDYAYTLASGQRRNLYNGNIGSMAVNIRKLSGGTRDTGPMIYNYQYDQLNRLVSMDPWAANGSFTPIGSSALPDFAERYTYDPNGNILTLSRNGDSSHNAMDNLTYNYLYAKTGGGVGEYTPGAAPTTGVDHLTNQLSSINDAVGATSYYPNDIENQSAYNYQYDAIGNMVSDAASGITGSSGITWSVYGKILTITNGSGTITYTYDASGNRISKSAGGITTWYVRDAQGNVMSVYTQGDATHNSGALTQTEAHLYGSSRLGLLNLNVNCTNLVPSAEDSLIRGSKLFELSNHLGNVLATISDKKLQHTSDGSTVDYYNSDVIGANDYYSFGMLIPGRAFNAGGYRYGFNGKENDNEVKGVGDQIDYGSRIYDTRVGKFLSIDPLQKRFPYYTPYQFSGNTPIQAVDLDGLEPKGYAPGMSNLFKDLTVKPVPSDYDREANIGTIGDYSGIINAYAVQDVDRKTYVIYESVHGERQWYVEYDKDGWKGNVNEFKWNKPVKVGNELYWVTLGPLLLATGGIIVEGAPLLWSAWANPYTQAVIVGDAGAAYAYEYSQYSATGYQATTTVSADGPPPSPAASAEDYANSYASDVMNSTPKSKWSRAVTAILDRSNGQVYFGQSGNLTEGNINAKLKSMLPQESLEAWETHNCAECDALNSALNAGAKVEDLEMHTLKLNKKTGKLENFERCDNCKVTTKDVHTTSDGN